MIKKAVIRCFAQIQDPTGGSGWWGFLDEQPEIVEEIDEEELIVQEVTQLGKLFRWWGAEERLLFMSLDGKEECIEQASVQSITRALIAKDGIPMTPHGFYDV